MKILSLIFCFVFLFISCINEDKGKVETISLDPTNLQKVDDSNLIKEITFLKLSANDDAIIGSIWNLQITEDRIYVLDAFNSVALFVFDKEGELLFKIDNYGRGPGEFMGPYAFTVDRYENQIIIFDGRGRKLCFYDIEDGSFIEERMIKHEISRLAATKDRYIFYLNNSVTGNTKHNLIITDKEFSIKDERLEIIPDMIGYQLELPVNFSSYNNNLFFTAPADYNIYRSSIDEESFEKYLKIDFGKRNLPASYYEQFDNNQRRKEEIGTSANSISNYFETDNFRFFKYVVGTDQHYFYLESKNTNDIVHTTYQQFTEKISSVGPLMPWPNAAIDNELVWYQTPIMLFNFLEKKKNELKKEEWKKFKEDHAKLISFSQTIEKEDNPYLIFTEIDF